MIDCQNHGVGFHQWIDPGLGSSLILYLVWWSPSSLSSLIHLWIINIASFIMHSHIMQSKADYRGGRPKPQRQ